MISVILNHKSKSGSSQSWNVFCVLCSSLTTHTTSFKGPTRNHHLSVCFGRASFDDSAHLIDHLVFALGLILWQRLKRSASYVYFIISRRLVSSRNGERVTWRDQTRAVNGTAASVAPIQFRFANNYSNTRGNRPQNTWIWFYFS